MVEKDETIFDIDDIYIYKLYEIEDLEYLNDDNNYFERLFSRIKDLRLGISFDDRIIDLMTGEDFNFITDELTIKDTYIITKPLFKFSELFKCKDKKILSKKNILELFSYMRDDSNLDNYINFIRENEFYYYDKILKDKNIINYYNDHDAEYYYDEYKEYRKDRILNR